jgi:hypothetical protein
MGMAGAQDSGNDRDCPLKVQMKTADKNTDCEPFKSSLDKLDICVYSAGVP